MRIYFDVCCLNRPFDDQSQDRVRLEAEAILLIMARSISSEWSWVSSKVVDAEVRQTPNQVRRQRLLLLLEQVDESITISSDVYASRVSELVQLGFKPFDAAHLAVAEQRAVNVFLTTDDRLLRRATRFAKQLSVVVANPLNWIQELE